MKVNYNMKFYTGYIYIWYDTKAKFFYLGGHFGQVEDKYICSNSMMLRAYNKRPETFRFKVLEYVNGSVTDLRNAEQRWLDKIKDEELYWTPNIYAKTVRYYNQKKNAFGGSVKGHKKNRTKPSPFKGIPMSEEQKIKISEAKKGKKFTEEHKTKLRKPHRKDPNKPKRTMSEEHKQKIREAHLGRTKTDKHKEAISNAMKEKHQRKSGLLL